MDLLLVALLSAAAAPAGKDAAREVLRRARCDHCHDSNVSTDNAQALGVYDLREQDWPSRLSDARLPRLLGRLRSAPAEDRALVQRFVDEELRARKRQ